MSVTFTDVVGFVERINVEHNAVDTVVGGRMRVAIVITCLFIFLSAGCATRCGAHCSQMIIGQGVIRLIAKLTADQGREIGRQFNRMPRHQGFLSQSLVRYPPLIMPNRLR